MREIKFRAWDKEFKYMNYKVLVGNIWDTDEKYTAHTMWIEPKYVSYKKESGWCHFDEYSNIELMQYTGLKDKNGKPIYEGDIVNSKIFGICEVRYEHNAFVLWDNGSYSRDYKNYVHDENIEVIGNIYQNPELLEKTKC